VFEYEITTDDNQLVFDKFYVPIISNEIKYECSDNNEKGTITEWCMLAFVVMEAGNEDLYYEYIDDFDVFIDNSLPTKTFMAICQQYTDEINESVKSSRRVDKLTNDMLSEYGSKADSTSLNSYNTSVMSTLISSGGKVFASDTDEIYAGEKTSVAFIDKEEGKVFISNAADEYPGDAYTEYKLVNESTVLKSNGSTANNSSKVESADKDDDDKDDADDEDADDEDEDDEDEDDEADEEDGEDKNGEEEYRSYRILCGTEPDPWM